MNLEPWQPGLQNSGLPSAKKSRHPVLCPAQKEPRVGERARPHKPPHVTYAVPRGGRPQCPRPLRRPTLAQGHPQSFPGVRGLAVTHLPPTRAVAGVGWGPPGGQEGPAGRRGGGARGPRGGAGQEGGGPPRGRKCWGARGRSGEPARAATGAGGGRSRGGGR